MSRTFRNSSGIVSLAAPIGSGGEGTVYAVKGNDHVVAKVLHRPSTTNRDKIMTMIGHTPWGWTRPGPSMICWPLDCLLEDPHPGSFAGYLMPRFAGQRLNSVFGRLRQVVGQQPDLPLHLASNLAHTLRQVHAAGHVVGDLNCFNILVGSNQSIAMIDTDSWQLRLGTTNIIHWTGVARPDYEAPELGDLKRANRLVTPAQDNYALAVLMFRLMMKGFHPFAALERKRRGGLGLHERMKHGLWAYRTGGCGNYSPNPHAPAFDGLPIALQSLFRLAFEDGQHDWSRRPSPDDWLATLETVKQQGGLYPYGAVPPASTSRRTHAAFVKARWPLLATGLVIGAVGLGGGLLLRSNRTLKESPRSGSPGQNASTHAERGKPTPKLWKQLVERNGVEIVNSNKGRIVP